MRSLNIGSRLMFAMGLIASPAQSIAQVYTFEVYDKEIDRLSAITPLPEFGEFGESIDMSSGSLSFRKTLVEIPGNNTLRVAADYIIKMRYLPGGIPDFVMERDVAYIEGTHSSEYGWIAGYAPTNYNSNRCSDPRALSPTQGAATIRILKPLDNIVPGDYWSGNTLYVPGERGGFVRPVGAGDILPSGITALWATNSGWRFSCYTLSDGSEGFVGHRPNGERYYFGPPVAQNANSQILSPNKPDVDGWLDVDKFRMYLTRVEDRFGNWVTITDGQIASSDGRVITFSSPNSATRTVTANGRTWSIVGSLPLANAVYITNPDSSVWSFARTNNISLSSSDYLNACSVQQSVPMSYLGQMNVSVTTESGATGTFVLQPRRRGYTHVQFDCNMIGVGSKEGYFFSKYMSFVDDISVISRSVSGPGIVPFSHSFDYGPVIACYAGTDPLNPEPCGANAPVARTTRVVSSSGKVKEFTYGNRFAVNAGRLLGETEGGLRETSIEHVSLLSNASGAGMSALGYDVDVYEVARPRKRVTVVSGAVHTTEVPATCGSQANEMCYDAHYRPIRVVRSSSPAN